MRKGLSTFLTLMFCLVVASCSDKDKPSESVSKLSFAHAECITDANLALLDKEYSRVAVDASVYRGLMDMLGVGDKCIDLSDNMRLDIERVVASKPDLLMLSAYDGADMEKFSQLGIPVVECRDFLEPTAIGRAEWMRLFGRLWGVGEKADSLFSIVEQQYSDISHKIAYGDKERPSVFFDLLYGNLWYQPVQKSTIGQLVYDAGGRLPFGDSDIGGSRALSAEQVLLKAKDADFWFIRSYSRQPLTLDALAKLNPVYSQFRAFKEGQVFVCYTDKTNYFEETTFRPDWLLKDFYNIISSNDDVGLHYFERAR